MTNKALRNFGLSITAILAVLFIFGMTVSTAKAAVVLAQYDTATLQTPNITTSLAFFQKLGTGLSGSIQYIAGSWAVQTVNFSGGGFTAGPRVEIAEYDDAAYTTLSGNNCQAQTNTAGVQTLTGTAPSDNGAFNTGWSANFPCAITLNPTKYYAIKVNPGGGGFNTYARVYGTSAVCFDDAVYTAGSDDISTGTPIPGFNMYFVLDTGSTYNTGSGCIGGGGGGVVTNTRIDAITPQPDSTVSTSTSFTFGGKGFVNEEDWTEDTVLYIRYGQQTGMGIRNNGPLSQRGEITLPITAAEDFDLSTTTSITKTGVYIGYIAIQKPRFSLFGFNFFTETLVSNTWLFTVGTSTQRELDATVLLLNTTGGGDTIASTTLTSNELKSCQNFLTGSTTECIISMFVPSSEQLTGAAGVMNTALSNNLPFSMFWQPYTLLKSISGSTTPIAGADIDVNMHNTFIQGTTTIFSWSGAKDTVSKAIPDSAVLYIVYAEWIFFGLYCIWRLTKTIS